MNTTQKHIGWLALFFIFSGCISEFHADISFADENILVIEGDIVANSEVDIILSKTFGLDEATLPDGYNNVEATIYLVGSDGYKSEKAVYMGKGIHRITVGNLDDDVSYGLEIVYDGETYISEPEKPLTTPEIGDINFHQVHENADVTIRVTTDGHGSGFSYYMWDYQEDWEIRSDFYTNFFYNPETRLIEIIDPDPYYYCWKSRRGKEIVVGSTESYTENKILNYPLCSFESSSDRFSLLYLIRVKQIALTKRAYEYFQTSNKLSEDMGGLFTPQPSELKGNVVCTSDDSRKVIGYINVAKNVTETQMYIETNEVSRNFSSGCKTLSQAEAIEIMLKEEMSAHDFYMMGYWPLDTEGETLYQVLSWSAARCIDCRKQGGSKTKPSFWPNNHQ